jgi:hypothetical protein
MDTILQTLLSWQFVFFSLGVAACVFVVRKIVEYLMANWAAAAKESKLWTELLLPILPVIMGAGGAVLLKMFPYPAGLTAASGRFVFGLVAGLLSTLLYRVINSLLGQKIVSIVSGVTSSSSSKDSPPPPPPAMGSGMR